MTDALIALHGYNPNGMAASNDFETVIEDRFQHTYEVAQELDSYGAETVVAISGGGDYDGKTEAEIVYDHVQSTFPTEAAELDFVLEDDSGNTMENVENLYDLAKGLDVNSVVLVTSRDHAPRALRDMSEHVHAQGDTALNVYASGSQDTYAASGNAPFIVEAAAFEPFVDALNNAMWGVNPNQYDEAAAAVEDVLRQFHD